VSKNVKTRIVADGVEGFFGRVREHARKLDKGEELAPEATISFEDPADMLRVLSPQRLRLLRATKQKSAAVTELARGLKRDTRAVSRDIDLLERVGLVHTRYEANPGHGKRRLVAARAAKYQLVANI
jgi:predicted transcriptional regulator